MVMYKGDLLIKNERFIDNLFSIALINEGLFSLTAC